MAQVPYSPVPEVGMQDISTPQMRQSDEAISGASGAPIGRAMQGLGKVLEHSGDELFRTAMKLQEQKNHAEALEAEVNYSLGVSEIHTKHASSEGRIPSDNLIQYRDDLNALRKKIREGLSSDAVRRMYDSPSLRTFEIAVRNGSSHAAAQLKQYSKRQAKATLDLENQTVYNNPNDDPTPALNRVEAIIRRDGAESGASPEEIEVKVRENRSVVVANRIEGMSNVKPLLAQEMLKDALDKNLLWGEHSIKLQEIVRRKVDEVEIRNASETIATSPTEISIEEARDQAKAAAEEIRPGDPVFRDKLVNDTLSKVRTNKAAKADDRKNAEETVTEAILDPEVKTFDHLLLRNPGIDKTINRTGPNYRREIQGKINRYQAALNKPRNDEEYGRVSAMRLNDPIAFAELDPTKLDVSTDQMNKIAAWQKADRKKPHDNPKVTQAMQWIREAKPEELRAINLYQRKKDDNEVIYDKYTWALTDSIDRFYEKNKRMPTRKEVIEEIAPPLITREMEKGRIWGQNVKTPALIQEPVPKAWEETLRAEARKKFGRELEPFEVGREWLRKRLDDIEAAKKKAAGNE